MRTKTIPNISEKVASRFWSHVDILSDNECWNWKFYTNKSGYGRYRIGNKFYYSNRIAWFLSNKSDPSSLLVCHSCDNPKCCNPKHLFLGTHLDNMNDSVNKGRRSVLPNNPFSSNAVSGEKNPQSKLTAQDVASIRNMYKLGYRQVYISRKFNITQSNVSRIVKRETWTDVP